MNIRRDNKQAGIALIAVLWVVVLLAVIAGSFSLTMRTDIQLANYALHKAKASGLMEAALSRVLAELNKPFAARIWPHDGSVQVWQFGDAAILISIQDAEGLLDLNRGDKNILKTLMVQMEIPEEQATSIADAIQDWKDGNNLTQLNGAEDPDYESAGLPYRSKDADFDTVEELRLVLGVTHEYYQKLVPFLTVHSQARTVATGVAPREILLAQPGFDAEAIEGILRRRQGLDETVDNFGAQPTQGAGQAFHVRFQVQFQNKMTFTNEAILTQSGFSSIPYSISAWKPGFVLLNEDDLAEGDSRENVGDEG